MARSSAWAGGCELPRWGGTPEWTLYELASSPGTGASQFLDPTGRPSVAGLLAQRLVSTGAALLVVVSVVGFVLMRRAREE
jgi:hypothetical protein